MRPSSVLFLALVAACGVRPAAGARAANATAPAPVPVPVPAIRGPSGHIPLHTLSGQPTMLAAYD